MAKIFDNIDAGLLKKFKAYHLANQHVYKRFREAAMEMRGAGRKKYSQVTIINLIRWEYDRANPGDLFKINNDFIALYARLLIFHDESFADFFELRTMKASDRRDSAEEQYRRKNAK
jgi:hypothetical protein